MVREAQRRSDIRRLAIALCMSVALHAIAFVSVTLDVPVFERPESAAALTVLELSNQWSAGAMRVVPLESDRDFAAGAAPFEDVTSAQLEASVKGAGGAETRTVAILPLAAVASAAPGDPAVDVTAVTGTPTAAPLLTAAPSNRGIIRRAANRGVVERDAGAGGVAGYDFVALSDAAREAERAKGGNGWGGIGGIGISIFGIGSEENHSGHDHEPGEYCPPGVIPGGISSGIGGVPTVGKGRGIIGRRPPMPGGGAAINRAGPPRRP